MARKRYNLAGMTSNAPGTGTFTLGTALPTLRTFAAAGVQDTETVAYEAVGDEGREVGEGVYTASGTTLTRVVESSTNGDAEVNFAGAVEVRIGPIASDFEAENIPVSPSVAGETDVQGAVWLGSGLNMPGNVGLAVSASSGALTIALKGADGNDPSSTNPVKIPFQNATGVTGTPVWRSITAANSLTLSSGSTLGVTSSTAFRIWIVAFDSGGVIRLGAINCSTGTEVYGLDDGDIASSTAEGGAGGADSAFTFYTGTAVTDKAYRVLGYLEWSSSGLTAGTWTTTNLIRVRLYGPGVHLPGDVVHRKINTTTPNTSTTSTTYDYVAGNPIVGYIPRSAANVLHVAARFAADNGATANTTGTFQMSRGTTDNTNMFGSESEVGFTDISKSSMSLEGFDKPNTTGTINFTVQMKTSNAANAVRIPTGINAVMLIEEIMG